jgi:hypothetical protein
MNRRSNLIHHSDISRFSNWFGWFGSRQSESVKAALIRNVSNVMACSQRGGLRVLTITQREAMPQSFATMG